MVGCVTDIITVGSMFIFISDRFMWHLLYKSAYMEKQSVVSVVWE